MAARDCRSEPSSSSLPTSSEPPLWSHGFLTSSRRSPAGSGGWWSTPSPRSCCPVVLSIDIGCRSCRRLSAVRAKRTMSHAPRCVRPAAKSCCRWHYPCKSGCSSWSTSRSRSHPHSCLIISSGCGSDVKMLNAHGPPSPQLSTLPSCDREIASDAACLDLFVVACVCPRQHQLSLTDSAVFAFQRPAAEKLARF